MEHDITLRGPHVTLEPLRVEDAAGLLAIVKADDDVWTWMPNEPRTLGEMEAWVRARIEGRPQGDTWAFAQRDPKTRQLLGSTSLFDVNSKDESGEIGFTWLAKPFRRTGANTDAKRLLMEYAFETLRLKRVQLVADARNARSRAAIERLGAVPEGVLRNVRRSKDGRLRNSAYYSVTDQEWPQVKARLQSLAKT